nr:hypothetical protein [Acetobacter syzygii]
MLEERKEGHAASFLLFFCCGCVILALRVIGRTVRFWWPDQSDISIVRVDGQSHISSFSTPFFLIGFCRCGIFKDLQNYNSVVGLKGVTGWSPLYRHGFCFRHDLS